MAATDGSRADVSVVIVNYNVRELLEHCLISIRKASRDLDVEIIVVDNNSADGSVHMLYDQFPDVVCIANEENAGFGRANNQGLQVASGEFFLILNPDTILQEDSLTEMVSFIRAHPKAGAVGCKIINPDGSFAPESRRSFPTPRVAFFRIVGLGKLFPRSPTFGRYNMTYLPENEETEVDALSGSCMLVRAAAVNSLGHGQSLFDEDFFMYGEDLDACYRLQQLGWQIWYTPQTQIIHFKGESTKKGELRYVRLFYGAMLLFAEKHFDNRYGWGMKFALKVSIFSRGILSALSTLMRRNKALLLDFLLIFLMTAVVGTLRSLIAGTQTSGLYYSIVAPMYAIGTVVGIGLARGYRRRGLHRMTPPILGVIIGALLVSSVSFFYKDIAFSRLSVALTIPAGWIALLIPRLFRYRKQKPSRALFAGTSEEARGLADSLESPFMQPLHLVGYVVPDGAESSADQRESIGQFRQLRDVVRLNDIDCVIFSSDYLSNEEVFSAMRGLSDLAIDLKILTTRSERIIGKTSVDEIVRPTFIQAESAIGRVRSRASKRGFDIVVSAILILLFPIRWLVALVQGSDSTKAVVAQTHVLGRVVRNDLALIGYRIDQPVIPPESWGLRAAVFSLVDTLQSSERDPGAVRTALWHYSTKQSTLFDLYILGRILSRPVRI